LRTVAEQEVFDAIRQAVSAEHGLEVQSIVLLKTASLPKTLTGKTRRQSCREDYRNGSLTALARWSFDSAGEPGPLGVMAETIPSVGRRRQQALRAWLVQKLAHKLNVPAADVDVRRPFAEYGFDSAAIVELAGDLEDYLGVELIPTLVYDYPTVESLCMYLAVHAVSKEAGQSSVG